jgi:hypothetical protein
LQIEAKQREEKARMVAPAWTETRHLKHNHWSLPQTQAKASAPDAKREARCWRDGEK